MEGVGTGETIPGSSQQLSLAQEIALEQAHLDNAYRRLAELTADARSRLVGLYRQDRGGTHQGRFERDAAVESILRNMSRTDVGNRPLLFGRIDVSGEQDGKATYHIGRLGILDENLDPLVVDWRAPVAEPFYRATGRDPMGLVLRRHVEVASRKVLSIEDERFSLKTDAGELQGGDGAGEEVVDPGPPGALLAALERPRDSRMSDMISTIQGEQDEIIRAPIRGVLVVQGGPGTGKTAVALHRAAYLLYTHRFPLETQGVLVVGPNPVFLRYIEHVLPSLGESGVTLSSVQGLVRGIRASYRDNFMIAKVKGDARMAVLLRRAVRTRQRPLRHDCEIPFGSTILVLPAAQSTGFVAEVKAHKGTHNAKRRYLEALVGKYLLEQYKERASQVRQVRPDKAAEGWISSGQVESCIEQETDGTVPVRMGAPQDSQGSQDVRRAPGSDDADDKVSDDQAPGGLWPKGTGAVFQAEIEEEGLVSQEELDARTIRRLLRVPELQIALDRMWPRLAAEEFLCDLFSSGVLISAAGRGLFDPAELALLERRWRGDAGTDTEGHTRFSHVRWSQEDVALLDEARTLLGPLDDNAVKRKPRAAAGGLGVHGRYGAEGYYPYTAGGHPDYDRARKYGYIVVDEAQGLSAMELRVIARRSLSGDMTLAGDIAQAVGPDPPSSWNDVLAHMYLNRTINVVELTVSYRTPREILDAAGPVLAAYMVERTVPRALRVAGVHPVAIRVEGEMGKGVAGVIGDIYTPESAGTCALIAPVSLCEDLAGALRNAGREVTLVSSGTGVASGLSVVPAVMANGLEFDTVVVIDPAGIIDESPMGLRSLYVAMTRPTKALSVVYSGTLPELLSHLETRI